MFAIRRVPPTDSGAWADLRHLLWPEATVAEHAEEIAQFYAGNLDEPQAVFVAEVGGGEIVGFVELSIRSHVPGCTSDRVGYIEGLYVTPARRRLGVARSLVRASRSWALENGCREFASDRADRYIVDRKFTAPLP
jgi:aminoglycoside 6'-N-acetyltransferase I